MYIFCVYLALAAFILYELVTEKRYRKLEIGIFIVLVLFFGIRFNLGRDFSGYYTVWNRFFVHQDDLLQYASMRNPGFYYPMYVSMQLFTEYRWFMLLVNIITLGLCSYTIYKNSKNILISLLIFIGSGVLEVYYASGIRQMLSMSVFFFAFYSFLPKKKILWYELFCLLAFSIHETAAPTFFLPILYLFVPKFEQKPVKTTIICFGISVLLAICVGVVIPYYMNHIPFDDYYWMYSNVISYFQEANPSIIGIGMELVFAAVILFLYFNVKDKTTEFTRFQVLTVLFSVCLYMIFAAFNLMSRVSDYLQITMIILIPELLMAMEKKQTKIWSFCGIALLNLFLLFMDLRTNIPAIAEEFREDYTMVNYPYYSIFDGNTINHLLRENK